MTNPTMIKMMFQNCYKLDINKFAKTVKRQDLIDHGLRFVMDYNKDRWGFKSLNDDTSDEGEVQIMSNDVLENKNLDYVEKGENARIYFQNIGIILQLKKATKTLFVLLEPLTFDGEGNYALSNVKEFAVTSGFINLGEEVTECQDQESFEECTTRKYLQLAREECSCTPFSLSHLNETVYL